MRVGGFSLGMIFWWFIITMGAPPIAWIIFFSMIFLMFIYLGFTGWYVSKRWERLNHDNPGENKDEWLKEYRKKYPVTSFLYYLFMD